MNRHLVVSEMNIFNCSVTIIGLGGSQTQGGESGWAFTGSSNVRASSGNLGVGGSGSTFPDSLRSGGGGGGGTTNFCTSLALSNCNNQNSCLQNPNYYLLQFYIYLLVSVVLHRVLLFSFVLIYFHSFSFVLYCIALHLMLHSFTLGGGYFGGGGGLDFAGGGGTSFSSGQIIANSKGTNPGDGYVNIFIQRPQH